jgi:hypothetical protein
MVRIQFSAEAVEIFFSPPYLEKEATVAQSV